MTESTGIKKKAEEKREDVIFMYRAGEHIDRIVVRSGYHLNTVKAIIKNYEKERANGQHAEEEVDGILRVL